MAHINWHRTPSPSLPQVEHSPPVLVAARKTVLEALAPASAPAGADLAT